LEIRFHKCQVSFLVAKIVKARSTLGVHSPVAA